MFFILFAFLSLECDIERDLVMVDLLGLVFQCFSSWCLICGFAIVERGDVASVFALITDACNEEWSKAAHGDLCFCSLKTEVENAY
jgi:hypothetical protein